MDSLNIPAVLLGLLLAWPLAARGADAPAGSPAEPLAESQLAPAAANSPPAHSEAASDTTRSLISGLTIFVLAVFVGFVVITKVPPTLHTPLMSGSNAISGITVVGAMVAAGVTDNLWTTILGTIAVALAMVNVVGGFLVTHRMLLMFRKK